MGSGSGPEDLGTDTGSGDSGAVCGARAASVVQEGGRAARPRRGLPGCGALNVPFMQSWDRVPFKARLAPPGAPSRHQVQNCVSSPPPVAPCCPEPTSQSRLFLRLHLSRFSSAPPPWTPLSSATWPCCSRRSCPVGSCRPTSGGCTTSVPTAPISSASTSPGRELRCHVHARHQRAQRLRRSHTGAGTRSYPCWRGWQPWRATPCSVALSPFSGHLLPGPQAHGPWAWLRRMKKNDVYAPRTDFFTVMHSRGPSVSPLLVWLEMWCHPQNKPAHNDGDQTFSPSRGGHFS